MTPAQVDRLFLSYADRVEQLADGFDEEKLIALASGGLVAAAQAMGAAGALRAVIAGIRESVDESLPTFDMTPADLHDNWTEVRA